jgi:hypothetical protein
VATILLGGALLGEPFYWRYCGAVPVFAGCALVALASHWGGPPAEGAPAEGAPASEDDAAEGGAGPPALPALRAGWCAAGEADASAALRAPLLGGDDDVARDADVAPGGAADAAERDALL